MRKLIFTGLLFSGLLFSSSFINANNSLPPQFQNCEEAKAFLAQLDENSPPYLFGYTMDYLEANNCL